VQNIAAICCIQYCNVHIYQKNSYRWQHHLVIIIITITTTTTTIIIIIT